MTLSGIRRLNKDVNMTEGPIFGSLWLYTIPIMLSGMLQLLYNAADVAVVGNYAQDSESALAAVGSTGALTNLIIGLFLGLSVGTNVVVSRYLGAHDEKGVSETCHTAMLSSVVFGLLLAAVGVSFAEIFLGWMDTPEDVLPLSALYMRIYFLGMPASMAYNFGSAILRSKGDTRYPFLVLVISGGINVILNLVTVRGFHLDVAGVAIATTTSQVVSAILVCLRLFMEHDSCRLELRKLKIHPDKLKKIARIGIPAGCQSMLYSITNVIIQSGVNSLGKAAMAGNTAASNVDGFIYQGVESVYHGALAFTAQNYGARNYKRIRTVCFDCCIIVLIVGLLLGAVVAVFDTELLKIYAPDKYENGVLVENKAQVREFGALRLKIMALTYFTCGLMDVATGLLRGLGQSLLPMVITAFGTCGLRIFWVKLIFGKIEFFHNMDWLYFTYPISWVLTGAAEFLVFAYFYAKKCRKHGVDPRHPIDKGLKTT